MNDEPTAHLDSEQEPPLLDWAVFSYLVAERADLYRAVIDVFADAKAEFSLHLRSGEIRAALTRKGWEVETTDVESTLGQLEAWGNLQSYQDNSDVASLAEYYRKRLLYQLTAEGEAALASSQNFAEQLSRAAKLDVRALERIVSAAGQMQRLVNSLRRAEPLDSAVVLTTLRNICQDAEELTSRAQSFFRWLHEQTEAERGDLESFLAYKQQLIDYLQDFVGELILRGGEIAGHLGAITDDELQALSEAAAEEDVGPPVAGQQEEHGRRVRGAAARWRFRLA
ncbi:MAG: TIGR02677 family protein, partial [Planctomycetota bacterium]